MRPVLPGKTGLVLNWGFVQPHDVEAFEMSKGALPVFLNVNVQRPSLFCSIVS